MNTILKNTLRRLFEPCIIGLSGILVASRGNRPAFQVHLHRSCQPGLGHRPGWFCLLQGICLSTEPSRSVGETESFSLIIIQATDKFESKTLNLFRLSPSCMHLGSRANCARKPYSTPTELKKLKLQIRIMCCLPLQETVGTTSPLHPNRS